MKYRKIAQEIIQMTLLDQKVRKAYELKPAYLRKMRETDRLNLTKIKKIVKQIGWPTISKVGKKASHFAWLLVQHADKNVDFQEHCLKLMMKVEKNNDISKADIAFLADRILVNRGRSQLYGTQFYSGRNGKLTPKSIIDIKALDKRRKEMGLESFIDYKKKIKNRDGPEIDW